MKKLLLLFCFLLLNMALMAQDYGRFQLEAGFNFNSVRSHLRSGYWDYDNDYVAKSKGGNSYNFFANNSLRLGKWFIDLEVGFNHIEIFQNIILPEEHPDPVSIDFKHKMNFFMPMLSVGRFIRFNEHFRMSLSVGMPYTFLLTKKTFTGFKVVNSDYPIFYAPPETIYDFRYSYYNSPGGAHASVGFYMPIGNNELMIKCRAMISGSTSAYVGSPGTELEFAL